MKTLFLALLTVLAGLSALHAAEPAPAPVPVAAAPALKPATLFSDHMVLQRDRPVPIWGTAPPDLKITVTFRDQVKSTTTAADGAWKVTLDALKVGGPEELKVNEITLTDVLVGDVWIGSGQSNMAMNVSSYVKGDQTLAKLAAETYPQVRFSASGGAWWTSDDKGNARISATLFAFGIYLHKELNVPVGLMVGAVGGTPSGYWLTEEMLKSDAPAQAALAKIPLSNFDDLKKKYEAELAAWSEAAAKAKENNAKEPKKPKPPLRPGESSGVIGNLFEKHVRPMVGYAITGVLWDQGESGTNISGLDQYHAMGALIGGWRKLWGQGEFPFIYIQKPTGGGCGWDAAPPRNGFSEAFSPLPAAVPNDGEYLETHIRIMTYPNTAMTISSDLGAALHPPNKSGYGQRSAEVALGLVYGKKIDYYGPMYAAHTVADGKVKVTFTHIGKGLAFKNGDKLQGFAVAGEDKAFQWADAVIDGGAVVLSSSQVAKPVHVRYAWSGKRTWANLFSQDGMPAIPFRTDQ